MKIHVFSKTSSVREITDSKDPALVTPAVVAGKRLQGEGECGPLMRVRQHG